jgi:hypothetical protein
VKSWRKLKERGESIDYKPPSGKRLYRKGTLHKPSGYKLSRDRNLSRLAEQLALFEMLGGRR